MDHDPHPIPETFTYTGYNTDELVSWYGQTLDHYELPHTIGYTFDGEVLRLTDNFNRNPLFVERGETLIYREKGGLQILDPAARGPEILARDHPRTVGEAQRVLDAQRKLGVALPDPKQMDFVSRRALLGESPTVTGPEQLAAAMQRHPSVLRTPAYGYTQPPPVGGRPTVHHPPRIRPV